MLAFTSEKLFLIDWTYSFATTMMQTALTKATTTSFYNKPQTGDNSI